MIFVGTLFILWLPRKNTLCDLGTQAERAQLFVLKEENEHGNFLFTMGETAMIAWLKIVHTEKDGRYLEELNLHWMTMNWSNPYSYFAPIVAKLYARVTYHVLPFKML